MFLVPSHVKTKYEIDIDMRDVDEDGYVWIQKKYVLYMYICDIYLYIIYNIENVFIYYILSVCKYVFDQINFYRIFVW